MKTRYQGHTIVLTVPTKLRIIENIEHWKRNTTQLQQATIFDKIVAKSEVIDAEPDGMPIVKELL